MTVPDTAELVTLPVEVRSVDEPKRIATMLVCRYGETSHRLQRPERFCAGAFTKSVTSRGDRIVFTSKHTGADGQIQRGTAVARPVSWDTTDPLELRAVLKFFDTPEAWNMFCRARDGEIDGASVGFKAVEERTADDGTREVTEAALHHVMLVDRTEETPAYDAPRLVEVRAAEEKSRLMEEAARLLAVSWDPGLADRCLSSADLARLVHGD